MTTPPKQAAGNRPREAESLLDQLAESALDHAYYEVNREKPPSSVMQVFTLVSMVSLGFLLSVVAVQSQNDRPATELERQALIDNIAGRQEVLDLRRQSVESLQTEIATLSSRAEAPSQAGQRDLLNAAGGTVVGDGVKIELSSAVGSSAGQMISDLDVQLAVNGLWMAGAEAIDVGGSRLSATSAIRSAGEGITVNFESISEPIVIRAIGSQGVLVRQFKASPSGRFLEDRARNSGISWKMSEVDEVRMSAAPAKRLEVRHASAVKKGTS